MQTEKCLETRENQNPARVRTFSSHSKHLTKREAYFRGFWKAGVNLEKSYPFLGHVWLSF